MNEKIYISLIFISIIFYLFNFLAYKLKYDGCIITRIGYWDSLFMLISFDLQRIEYKLHFRSLNSIINQKIDKRKLKK